MPVELESPIVFPPAEPTVTDYLHDIYEEQKAQRKAMERIADALEQIAEGQ